jgi:uncharacterized protein YceK
MKAILLILCILLSGCGTYVTSRQKEVAAQSYADLDAAAQYVENTYTGDVPALAADAMRSHAANMAKAMEIDVKDLPPPRVTAARWRDNPNDAHNESRSNAASDNNDIAKYGLWAMTGISLAVLGGRLGMMVLSNHPIGQMLGTFGQLFGGESPKQRKVFKKMISILEEYKTIDPAWKDNKLYAMLSDRLTTSEKDFIKTERENV